MADYGNRERYGGENWRQGSTQTMVGRREVVSASQGAALGYGEPTATAYGGGRWEGGQRFDDTRFASGPYTQGQGSFQSYGGYGGREGYTGSGYSTGYAGTYTGLGYGGYGVTTETDYAPQRRYGGGFGERANLSPQYGPQYGFEPSRYGSPNTAAWGQYGNQRGTQFETGYGSQYGTRYGNQYGSTATGQYRPAQYEPRYGGYEGRTRWGSGTTARYDTGPARDYGRTEGAPPNFWGGRERERGGHFAPYDYQRYGYQSYGYQPYGQEAYGYRSSGDRGAGAEGVPGGVEAGEWENRRHYGRY